MRGVWNVHQCAFLTRFIIFFDKCRPALAPCKNIFQHTFLILIEKTIFCHSNHIWPYLDGSTVRYGYVKNYNFRLLVIFVVKQIIFKLLSRAEKKSRIPESSSDIRSSLATLFFCIIIKKIQHFCWKTICGILRHKIRYLSTDFFKIMVFLSKLTFIANKSIIINAFWVVWA